MTQIPLTGGFYKAASIIADAQRCLNLYPERNPPDSPFPYTHYLTPGLVVLASGPNAEVRGEWTASDGVLWAVIGNRVYWADSALNLHGVGTIGTISGQVSMDDNGLVVVLVDGSASGYCIDMASKVLAQIVADPFYGADIVRFVDTFFIFNKPGTNIWYISLAEVNQANLTGGPILTVGSIVGGTLYPNGIFPGVALTGGTGDGAVAVVTVSAGIVSAVDIEVGGENYRVGDVLGLDNSALGGEPATGTIVGGSGYSNGSHAGVALTGGSGTGAVATIVVASGVVTTVTVTAGSGYLGADILSLGSGALGGGSGFSYTVLTVTSTGSGFSCHVATRGSSGFDPLDLVAITGEVNQIASIGVINRQLWIIGDKDYGEIWYNAGTPDFPFARTSGVSVQHGSAATHSMAQWDVALFWLGIDEAGNQQVYRGADYQTQIITTAAVSAAISGYATTSDAIGFCYQQKGHVFYVLTFPSADATWVYDIAEKLWHEWAWTDADGQEHRHRANCQAFAYGKNIVGDWQNGQLYQLDPKTFNDAGSRIARRRGFPHLLNQQKRISVRQFIADMDVGEAVGLSVDEAPEVSLRSSITKGKSWGNPRTQSVGSTGQADTNIQFNQLGMGRDWVFELFWDFDAFTALNGAWIEAVPAAT